MKRILSFVVFVIFAGSGTCFCEEAYDLHSDKAVGYGAETSFLNWHGYLNFEYDKAQSSNSNFDNHEFYLSANSIISERVGITAEFEYEHTPEKLICPIQAYADLKVTEYLTFRCGLFYTPIGLPRSYNLRGNKNRMIRQVALTHDILFENWAEVGIEFFGQFPSGVFYDIAFGNGMRDTMGTGDSWFDADETLKDHSEDNNDNKAFHGRFGYQSSEVFGGDLALALSFGTQKYDDADEQELTHFGGDVRYLHKSGLRVQSEVMSRSGDDDPDFLPDIAADAFGWYVQVSKRFSFDGRKWLSYLEPAIQIDSIDLNTDYDSNGDKLTTALALIYCPEEYYLVKFEYDLVEEQHGEDIDNNKLWAAVVVEF